MDQSKTSHHSCCNADVKSNVHQSLSEMDFERGIWYAAQYNDLERVQKLLNKGVSSNIEDSAGYSALHYAARNGHYKICEILLQYGANVDALTRCGRATALHRAATQGHEDIVNVLLKFGANANILDADGCTALHRAFVAKNVSVAKLLVNHTDLDSVDNHGQGVKDLIQD